MSIESSLARTTTYLRLIQLLITQRQVIMPSRKRDGFLASDATCGELQLSVADFAGVEVEHGAANGGFEGGHVLIKGLNKVSETMEA